MTRIAVLGLGRMGTPMAARLIRAGHDVTVWNRGESGYRRLTEELTDAESPAQAAEPPAQTVDTRAGVVDSPTGTGDSSTRAGDSPPGTVDTRAGTVSPTRATDPAAAVANADIVITMLADAAALDTVLFGPNGVATTINPGTIVCDMATIGVDAATRSARRLAELGVPFLDAPVSGSVATVRAGALLVMIGGPTDAAHTVEPVLRAFAKDVIHVGGTGSGQAMKLAVNSVVHSLNASLSEAIVLAERGGVPRDTALDVLANSVVAAPFLLYKRAAFADPANQPVAFTIDLMRKDLHLIEQFAASRDSPVPVATMVRSVSDKASDDGFGAHDMSAIAEHHRTRRK
ncbi:MAG TPA: NAD(P)-dependent oxidoreductase [Pseudonocardiaceae bacterium]|nr:NAD(P)-dependent oxidoreductase [Pseudonocardiaceae bacterium]